MSCEIDAITLERYSTGFGIRHDAPRISWRFKGDARDWMQHAYQIRLRRENSPEEMYEVHSTESLYVPWPSTPIRSRERLSLSISAISTESVATEWKTITVERALSDADWSAGVSFGPTQDPNETKRPYLLRRIVNIASFHSARLYISALGLYEAQLNGQRVGDDLLAPGWQSYTHRLHYQAFDISPLLQLGRNELEVWVGEGWYAGRLGWAGGRRNMYGSEIGLIAQLEVDKVVVVQTGEEGWDWAYGSLLTSELYDGESIDLNVRPETWHPARSAPRPSTALVAAESVPVRVTEVLKPRSVIQSPNGATIFDFGQNFVGWVRLLALPPNATITMRHAEVLENGELGTRPLRICKATDMVITPRSDQQELLEMKWEPKFTFHGFRYVQIDGFHEITLDRLEGVVVHSDMEQLGTFECSHGWMNQFHKNTQWGLRGNFLSIPTDCPQRDERMGWTGDLQAFCSTANFLYNTSSLLGDWLWDLRKEQEVNDGLPPLVVPDILHNNPKKRFAIWGDVVIHAPYDLYSAFGDQRILEDQWNSMVDWLEVGVVRDSSGLWDPQNQQLGDWLDPSAPDDVPDDTHSDPILVANCFLVHTTWLVSQIARQIGKTTEAESYHDRYLELLQAFQNEYITPSGNIMSDTHATLALALHFSLYANDIQRARAAKRLDFHVRRRAFKVYTGFAGTPVILPALASSGYIETAYRMFQEKQCPSLLYPISMGATTIWERWNSILPDGSINPGEMTSFNHYALGSVSRFLYETVGGLSPLEPGWKIALIRPQPGGSVTWCKVSHVSPYGLFRCEWRIDGGRLKLRVEVPPNASAKIVLAGREDELVGSGYREFEIPWEQSKTWPPRVLQPPPLRPQLIDEVVD